METQQTLICSFCKCNINSKVTKIVQKNNVSICIHCLMIANKLASVEDAYGTTVQLRNQAKIEKISLQCTQKESYEMLKKGY